MKRLASLSIALIALAAGALALPAGAGASHGAEISIMDDQLLLGRSQGFIDRQMSIFASLGVDRVRVSAFWDGNAPSAGSRQKPPGFDGANPNDPRYRWGALDRVVSSASSHGLKVMLSVTTPAPLWATKRFRKPNRVWKPSATEFGAYAEAVARRYGAVIDHYGISNEPNQGGWLQPQSTRKGLISPGLYRAMARAAYPRIKRADRGSTALLGNLAPTGSSRARGRRAPIRPLTFLRAMACVNRHYRPIHGGSCRHFKPIPTDAIGHHPYQYFAPPGHRSRSRDDATIGDTGRFLRVVDALVRRHRIRTRGGRRPPVYYTEFGYQTDPPDPFSGISLRRQSRFLQQAAFLAWRSSRVRGLNQFRLTDGRIGGRGLAAFKEFQSGLMFGNRRPKPSLRSFPHPFVIAGRRFWGQVRPGGAHTVAIQFKRRRGGRFRTVRRAHTNRQGYFSVRLRRRHGFWRFRYDDGPSGKSDVLRIR